MIKQAIVLRCRPESLFHLGRVAVDSDTSLNDTSEHIHSDTLVAALMSLAVKVFPMEKETIFGLFGWEKETPSVRLSSAFYCVEKERQFLYFLPKPIDTILADTTILAKDNKSHKDVKAVKFLSKSVLENGLSPIDWFNPSKCQTVQKGKFIVTVEEAKTFELTDDSKIYDIIPMPKVAIRTETKENTFYYQTNLQLGNLSKPEEKKNEVVVKPFVKIDIHFYFLAEFDENILEKDRKTIETLLRLLPAEGIGGERAAGCGRFDGADFKDFAWEKPIHTEGGKFLSLSLSNPSTQDEFKAFEKYQLTTRGGRNLDSKRKLAKVQMIAEGAILNKPIVGRIVDIMIHAKQAKDTQHFRSGICLALPL